MLICSNDEGITLARGGVFVGHVVVEGQAALTELARCEASTHALVPVVVPW